MSQMRRMRKHAAQAATDAFCTLVMMMMDLSLSERSTSAPSDGENNAMTTLMVMPYVAMSWKELGGPVVVSSKTMANSHARSGGLRRCVA
eukprot:35841-Eustigmatos_ZCMA.PRE.1